MYLKRTALLVSFSLAFVALLHLSARAQESPNLETVNAQIRALQQKRVDVLQQAVEEAREQFRQGILDFQSVYATQRDLLDAQLDMAGTREERIRLLTSQLKIARDSLEISEMKFQNGLITSLDVHRATSAALRIEIQLLKLQRPDEAKRRE